MNPLSPRNEVIRGCKPSPNGLPPVFAVASKRAFVLASGTPLYCAKPRAWRLCDGL
jgi:hypothetical protein